MLLMQDAQEYENSLKEGMWQPLWKHQIGWKERGSKEEMHDCLVSILFGITSGRKILPSFQNSVILP